MSRGFNNRRESHSTQTFRIAGRPAPAKDGPRVNEEIFSRTILLIGDDGHKYGEIGIDEARAIAEEKGFDLVEVSPEAKPPVVKLMDYGKFKYEQQKKAAEARKKQKVIEIKEIKMRPTIDDHDYETKMKAMRRFFDEGDKVKVTLRFRGREMAHQHLGMELLNRITQGHRDLRQDGAVAEDGRPPDDDGAGAALGRLRHATETQKGAQQNSRRPLSITPRP